MKFFKKSTEQKSETRPQNPQLVASYMTNINAGTKVKVKRLVEQDKIIDRNVILERCAGIDAPWRKNKVAMMVANSMNITEEFIEAAVRDCVTEELKKYSEVK